MDKDREEYEHGEDFRDSEEFEEIQNKRKNNDMYDYNHY